MVRQVAKSGETILGGSPSIRCSATPLDDDAEILTIYEMFSSKNQRKRALRELYQIHNMAATESWTDIPITFDEKDEPRSHTIRAPASLVLNPIVDEFRLNKALMDGGSGLNLIYEDTQGKMQFNGSRIEKRLKERTRVEEGIR